MEIYDMKSSPHLLVIGAKEHTLKKLKAMGIHYILIQSENDPLTLYLDKRIVYVDHYSNLAEIRRIATQLHQIYQFIAVVSFTELGLYPAALIAEQLGIKGNAVFPVEYTRDKFKMRRLLEKHQLASIEYQNCSTLKDVSIFYKKINAPFILKPVNGAGSQGVFYVDSAKKIPDAWNWSNQYGKQELIAEEYILGKEYSVESLSLNGRHQIIAITEKCTTEYPHFIELSHYSPARLDPAMQKRVCTEILRFLDVIQQQNGPAHTEIKIHRNNIKIIESQTRMGGDRIWELTELTTGMDVISETVIHLLGLDRKTRIKTANAAVILFFAREFEEIIDISGLESVKKQPGIIRVACTLEKGQKLGKLISSESRQGYILASGNDIDEAVSAVNLAVETVQIKTRGYIN